MVAAAIGVHARGARGHADDAEVAGRLGGERPRPVDAIGERAGVDEERDQIVERLLEPAQVRAQLVAPLARQIALDAAERDRAPQEPRAEQAIVTAARGLRAAPARGWPGR